MRAGFWWGKPGAKRQLEAPIRRRWDNIKAGRQEIGWEDVGQINVAQVTLVTMVMKLRVPLMRSVR
jgi:hypothetical protein